MDKYKERLEKVEFAFDYMLTQLSKTLSKTCMLDIHLQKIVGKINTEMHIHVGLEINGKSIILGNYATDPALQNIMFWVKVSHITTDIINTRNKIDLYDMATGSVLDKLMFGTDLMNLYFVINKWKKENGR